MACCVLCGRVVALLLCATTTIISSTNLEQKKSRNKHRSIDFSMATPSFRYSLQYLLANMVREETDRQILATASRPLVRRSIFQTADTAHTQRYCYLVIFERLACSFVLSGFSGAETFDTHVSRHLLLYNAKPHVDQRTRCRIRQRSPEQQQLDPVPELSYLEELRCTKIRSLENTYSQNRRHVYGM